MGGAMDLVASAKNIIVAMMHTDKEGNSKLLKQCSLPITGLKCVKRVVTDLGFFEITENGFLLKEYAPGVTIEEIKAKTEGRLEIATDVKEMEF
jgi:3-oxoacid CoA-transferase subunit B